MLGSKPRRGLGIVGDFHESQTLISVVTNSSSPPGWRGRHWNALEYPRRVFATGLTGGLRPINTAYLPTVDSVVENIDSHLQQSHPH
jgi:hypothetical protein